MTVVHFLHGCPVFAGLSDEQLQVFVAFSRQEVVEERTVIFREGDPARFLYVVVKGRVAIEMAVQRPDGGRTQPTTVATLGPGEAFGWSAVVEPHVMTLCARALERCDLVLVEAETLREVVRRYRDLGCLVMTNLAKLLAHRLAQTREALVYERGWAMVG